jgi:hypothetical protein
MKYLFIILILLLTFNTFAEEKSLIKTGGEIEAYSYINGISNFRNIYLTVDLYLKLFNFVKVGGNIISVTPRNNLNLHIIDSKYYAEIELNNIKVGCEYQYDYFYNIIQKMKVYTKIKF